MDIKSSDTHLIRKDGKGSFHAVSGAFFSSARQTLSVVADLSLECVDMGDDLFGTDDILRDVDDGLGAGQRTAAGPERA